MGASESACRRSRELNGCTMRISSVLVLIACIVFEAAYSTEFDHESALIQEDVGVQNTKGTPGWLKTWEARAKVSSENQAASARKTLVETDIVTNAVKKKNKKHWKGRWQEREKKEKCKAAKKKMMAAKSAAEKVSKNKQAKMNEQKKKQAMVKKEASAKKAKVGMK